MAKKFAKLSAVRFGVAFGIVSAIVVAIITIAGLFGAAQGWTQLLLQCYRVFGYSISLFGIILGAIYAFIDGFILAGIFALLYNRMV